MRGPGFYSEAFFKIKAGDALIKESITRILMTTPGERVGRPKFGSNLRKLLFESQADIYINDVKRMIEGALNRYEPRVNLRDIVITADGNNLYIRLEFNEVGNPLNENFLEYEFELEG